MAKSGKVESDAEGIDKNKIPRNPKSKNINNNSKDESTCVVFKPPQVTTSISILIESLVQHLCNVYERDGRKATDMYKFICSTLFRMNLIDESYNMNEFEGMRSQYQSALFQLLNTARGDENSLPLQPVWPECDVISSHYYHEFDEEEYIAGGGFGQVYRVKHKLDGTEYAVKKIPIRSDGIECVKTYLSEVKTFASLNHSNIVQYKAAWLELRSPKNDHAILDNISESECFVTNRDAPCKYEHIADVLRAHLDSLSLRKEESSDFEVKFESNSLADVKHYAHSNDNLSTHQSNKTSRQKRNSVSEGGNAICTLDFHEIQKLAARDQPKWATLYIQMALCQSTLKQWLEKRNLSDEVVVENETALVSVSGQVRNDTIMEILRQLLRGLEYIHSKGIVHHDIKPSNIFVQLDNGTLLVQLGDFGLACPLQSVRHSLALGTKLYAAPEQLAGKCNAKSDMYSLGIVLFELVETFRTDMERVQNITELRKGHLPKHVQPQFARIISQLVCRNPNDRPSAAELLKCITIDVSESEHIRELEMQLADKDEEIARLKELLKTAGVKSI